jgi:hypothetical protein
MNRNELNFERRFAAFFSALLFASIISLVNWETVQGVLFEDRQNFYFVFNSKPDFDVPFSVETLFFHLFNEQLWNKGVRTLVTIYHLSLDEIFSTVSFLLLFTFSYFVASRSKVYIVPLLLNPIVIDLAFSQLRMSMALVFLMFAASSRNLFVIISLFVVGFFIHTATMLFAALAFGIYKVVQYSIKNDYESFRSYLSLVVFGLIVAVIVGPLRTVILEFFGDRRATYEIAASGWAYASFWLFLLGIMMFQRRDFYRSFESAVAVSMVSTFVFCTAFGVYGIRFIAASFPIILVSMYRLGHIERPFVFLSFMGFSIFQWIFWIR